MYPIIVTSHVVTFNAISVYINMTNVHRMTNNKWNNFAQGYKKGNSLSNQQLLQIMEII